MTTQNNEFLEKRVAKVTFDATNVAGVRSVASHGTQVYIPSGAIVTNAYFNVTAGFTSSSGNTGTIAITVEGTGDLVAAIAVSGAPYSSTGLKGCLPGSYAERTVSGDSAILDAAAKAGSYILTTQAREITFTVATAALTAGILNLYVEYVVA